MSTETTKVLTTFIVPVKHPPNADLSDIAGLLNKMLDVGYADAMETLEDPDRQADPELQLAAELEIQPPYVEDAEEELLAEVRVEGPLEPETVINALLLVDVTVDKAEVRDEWSDAQQRAASEWAMAVHLDAGDNDVVVPPCPFVVPPDDTMLRLAADPVGAMAIWEVWIAGEPRVGQVTLPAYCREEMVKRFAYREFKSKLSGYPWYVQRQA